MHNYKEKNTSSEDSPHAQNIECATVENLHDARFVLFSFLFAASLSVRYTCPNLMLSSLIYTLFLLYIIKHQNKSRALIFAPLFFCSLWFLAIVVIRSLSFQNGLSFTLSREILLFSFAFVLKIYITAILGLCMYLSAKAKEYALSVAWFFSIFSKKHGWKMGLITLLVLKSFKDLFKIATHLKIGVHYRMANQKIHKKLYFYTIALLRKTAQRNYETSVGLYTRKLNNKEAFQKEWEGVFTQNFLIKHLFFICLCVFSCTLFVLSL